MCLIHTTRRVLLNVALSGFVVTVTVSCIAQSYLVSVYEPDARPGITSVTLASGRSQQFKTPYDGIPDINAVRNLRNGCNHGLGNRHSVALGQSYARQVQTMSQLVTDPVITEYIDRMGRNLAHNSDADVQLTLKIIDANEINAVSLPGGFIFIDSGLILAASNEAELAGVISHEIAHVVACHPAQEMAYAELTNPGSRPLIYRFLFHRFTLNTIYPNPARGFEFEADSLGIEYLYNAGYDPQAVLSMLEKVRAIEEQKPGNRVNAFGAPSLTMDRIARARQKIKTLLPPAREHRADSADFQRMKQRLSELNATSITKQQASPRQNQ